MATSNDNDGTKSTGNLVSIKKKSDQGPSKKPKARDIHAQVVDAMLGKGGRLPPFPVKFHRWVDHEGSSLIYKETPERAVSSVVASTVDHEIFKYWEDVLWNTDNFWGPATADDVAKIRKLWFVASVPTSRIWLPMAMADDPRSALVKLAWGKADAEGFNYESMAKYLPCFNKIMTHITDHKVLMEWIGSIFDPESQRQQYAWLYGEGRDGKGCLAKALTAVIGGALKVEHNFKPDDKFWSYFIKDKRLLVFPDMDNSKLATSGLWKSLTGEDDLRMEIKGGASFTRSVSLKCLVFSNERPSISSKRADMRRALVFRAFGKFNDGGGAFEEKLLSENKPFIQLCYKMYLDKTKGDSRHQFVLGKTDYDLNETEGGLTETEKIAEDNELEYEVFARDYIVVTNPEDKKYLSGRILKELMIKADIRSVAERASLARYLERKHGIRYAKAKNHNGDDVRGWINCMEHPKPNVASDPYIIKP